MRILSFNSSTADLHICLAENETAIAEEIITCDSADVQKNRSRQFAASLIIPVLNDLLTKNAWSKSAIEAIVVGVGPGSFTGIRIAVVTARTLAQALSLPLLGINEFECYAFQQQIRDFPAIIAIDAGKGQYYCAHLEAKDDETFRQFPWKMTIHHVSQEELDSHREEFKNIHLLSINLPVNQASIQSRLAHQKLAETGQTAKELNKLFPYQAVKPLYVRNASITINPANKSNR